MGVVGVKGCVSSPWAEWSAHFSPQKLTEGKCEQVISRVGTSIQFKTSSYHCLIEFYLLGAFIFVCLGRVILSFSEFSRTGLLTPLPPTGLQGLLDRQFRLLREDTIGPLRDAVRVEIEKFSNPSNDLLKDRAARTIGHPSARLARWEVDRRRGLQIIVEFDQPLAVKSKATPNQRQQVWTESRQMQKDSLVCLVSSSGRSIFFSVCDPTPTRPPKTRQNRGDDIEEHNDWAEAEYERRCQTLPSLITDQDRATVALNLVEYNEDDITWINLQSHQVPQPRQTLVEFPGILLPSFFPILQALQKMSQTLDLPFAEWIAPESSSSRDPVLEPPAYARKRGFAYNLKSLVGGAAITFTPGQPFDHKALQAKTALDQAQQVSVIHALSSELALIQGPPGTGKSYTGVSLVKTLLDSCKQASSGPILIVCYTNHALDQFLETLVKDQVEQIIRLGGRSQSEMLEQLTLHHLTHTMEQTKTEGHERWHLRNAFEIEVSEVENLLSRLKDVTSLAAIRGFLNERYPEHFRELFELMVDEDEFQLVQDKGSNRLRHWLRGSTVPAMLADKSGRSLAISGPRSIRRLSMSPLRSMTNEERHLLYNHWIGEQTEELNDKLLAALTAYNDARAALDKCNQEVNLRCLLQARIISCTTTGLAKNLEVLRRLRAKIVMIEEAGKCMLQVISSH